MTSQNMTIDEVLSMSWKLDCLTIGDTIQIIAEPEHSETIILSDTQKALLASTAKVIRLEARLEELESQVPVWVSTKDKQPKSGMYVVGLDAVTFDADFYTGRGSLWSHYRPTHWLKNLPPLPTAPTEEKDDEL